MPDDVRRSRPLRDLPRIAAQSRGVPVLDRTGDIDRPLYEAVRSGFEESRRRHVPGVGHRHAASGPDAVSVVTLSEAIAIIRREIQLARASLVSANEDVAPLYLEGVEVEFEVVFGSEAGGEGELRVPLVGGIKVGGKVNGRAGHRLRFRLLPEGEPSDNPLGKDEERARERRMPPVDKPGDK